jgi:hypothetical protein
MSKRTYFVYPEGVVGSVLRFRDRAGSVGGFLCFNNDCLKLSIATKSSVDKVLCHVEGEKMCLSEFWRDFEAMSKCYSRLVEYRMEHGASRDRTWHGSALESVAYCDKMLYEIKLGVIAMVREKALVDGEYVLMRMDAIV